MLEDRTQGKEEARGQRMERSFEPAQTVLPGDHEGVRVFAS